MATIKETRFISGGSVRQLCIRENYYTNGTNAEYEVLLNAANRLGAENVTADGLYSLAKNIYEHSEMDIYDANEAIAQIMYCLNLACVTTYTITD